nr:MAG TPA: hypothetical protein [Caudoviricetes sp.]
MFCISQLRLGSCSLLQYQSNVSSLPKVTSRVRLNFLSHCCSCSHSCGLVRSM